MPARLPGSAFLVAPPPAARAVERAQAKALTDWGHAAPVAPPVAPTTPAPGAALREPWFGGAAQHPEPPPPAADPDEPQPLFGVEPGGPRRTGRLLLGALAFAAVVGAGVWLVVDRRPVPVAEAPPPEPAPATATAAPDPPPAPAPVPSPALAGSPQQDAPSEAPGEADYRAAVEAARAANAASRWELEAEEYRRALAVRPASLEAKEGLGAAIVKSSGKAGSYLEAERLLADVVTADQSRSRAWLVLGMARQLGARPAPAIEAYKRYLELAPPGPTASDVRAVVRELGARDMAQRRSGR
jgi:tetratricopeptide (TPR) repeat protein